jgi:hypothetical protein
VVACGEKTLGTHAGVPPLIRARASPRHARGLAKMVFRKFFFWKKTEEDLTLADRVSRLEQQWNSLPYGLRKGTRGLGMAKQPIVDPGATSVPEIPNFNISEADFEKLQIIGRQKGWLR